MYRFLHCILFVPLLISCSLQQQKEEPPVLPVATAPEKPRIVPKRPALPIDVAILVSSDIPAYREVADALVGKLGGRARSWYLPGERQANAKVLAEVAQSQRPQVVAIGLDAAIGAKQLTDRQVIFCQVFNYQEHKLPSEAFKGVGMLPSFEKSLEAWKAISPELKTIAVITGPGLAQDVRKATAVAKAKGITLLHRQVTSDKELQVVFKSIANKVDGYWLWPDNRVLSGVVMREVMTFSARNGEQVLVFNDELLALGGLLSVTSDHHDIADKVIQRLEKAQGQSKIPGEVIESLDEAKIRINPVMVKRFDLTVPAQYRKYLHAP